jgi:hypothetical protein
MPKRRIGTIQSFRPGYGALMYQSVLYGKPQVVFQTTPAKNGKKPITDK